MLTDETELLTLSSGDRFQSRRPWSAASDDHDLAVLPAFGGVHRDAGAVLNSFACWGAENGATRHGNVLGMVTAMAELWTAAISGYAERKNYCELGMERMSTRTAGSPSTRVCAR